MCQRFKQWWVRHGIALLIATEDGGEIETETVDMIVGHPITQALHNHVAHIGVVAVERIAATAEVEVTAIGR